MWFYRRMIIILCADKSAMNRNLKKLIHKEKIFTLINRQHSFSMHVVRRDNEYAGTIGKSEGVRSRVVITLGGGGRG